jgi:hypothetical protein
VEKQDGERLDAFGFHASRDGLELREVDVLERLAGGIHALVDLEAQRALDERPVLAEKEVVRIRPVDAADLVHVAKALGRHERGARAVALEHHVDRDGAAVQEKLALREMRIGAGGGMADALDDALRRGKRFLPCAKAVILNEL